MTVKEFCKKYNLKYQTVYKKIAHHKNKELAGHVTKIKGESIDLDDYAVDFLTPFNVKVIRTVEECEAVISENSDLKDRLYAAELNLEQAEAKLSDIIAENEKLSAKITELTADLSDKSNQISECIEHTEQLELQCEDYRQKISELEHKASDYEKSIAELTEVNSTFKAQLEAVPRIFRKNQ